MDDPEVSIAKTRFTSVDCTVIKKKIENRKHRDDAPGKKFFMRYLADEH
jgi:hypothetical protein